MAPARNGQSTRDQQPAAAWQGRSGRLYGLESENLADFAMDETGLFLLAKGRNVLWVGATEDLVADPLSRARFRLAMSCADRVFRLAAQPGERLTTIYDLEGAAPAPDFGAGAQAA